MLPYCALVDHDPELLGLVQQLLEFATSTVLRLRDALLRMGLSESTAGVLWMLDPAQPSPSLRELARRLGCDPSNVTLISERLEADGLAARHPHPVDRRSRVLTLSPAGVVVRNQLLAALVETTPVGDLPVRDRAQLVRLLDKLTRATS